MEKCVECFDEMKLTNAGKETFESIVGVLKRMFRNMLKFDFE